VGRSGPENKNDSLINFCDSKDKGKVGWAWRLKTGCCLILFKNKRFLR
jgi:hypothetical protein